MTPPVSPFGAAPDTDAGARLRLGIVGYGAITESKHLPAALASPLESQL